MEYTNNKQGIDAIETILAMHAPKSFNVSVCNIEKLSTGSGTRLYILLGNFFGGGGGGASQRGIPGCPPPFSILNPTFLINVTAMAAPNTS